MPEADGFSITGFFGALAAARFWKNERIAGEAMRNDMNLSQNP
jgi:hypothetical protein